MQTKAHVIIAGAGIGGLTAALALLQRGFDVDVYEQASELREVGAGVQIAANGTRVLINLGLKDRLCPLVCEAAAKEVRIWNTGQTRKLFDLGADSAKRFGAPYWMIHRGDLHRVLLEAVKELKADAVHVNARCIGFRQDAQSVDLQLADGRSIHGDILIGADGVHSQLRAQMFHSPKAEFTGLMAWRGLAPMDQLSDELQRPVGTNWIGPGGHVITYPIRGNTLLNFVGLVENREWTSESWTEAGTKEECAADFAGWHPLINEVIKNFDTPFRWALVGREPLEQWTQGRVTLLGDACHPTLPFLAQGAIMAIEDGLILARCLQEFSSRPEQALMVYENLRKDRTTAIVRGSFANLERFHNAALADPITAAAHLDHEWEPEKVRRRYDWLFEYDATQLALA
ncbi:FAD-dependent monooxygenase [Pseudorhodoplanes sinuspersici]|uniref:FAD-dependent monooxygenase n=1 Tax=Pseudorhodoplanes sinuspersici TaxID=1235591 RepID=UPI000FF3C2E7|nr:FAD-dependent monooxygenase [Pseudorhodoplanes sinuspersici]RKE68381.1 salicylate hydroxylase [Pseudorhodoplanes sinuspersici]